MIDDWGYNLNGIELLKQFTVPLTISILPNLRYSAKVAEIAHSLNQEVILHLPLEPEKRGRDYIGLEKDTITSDMDDEQIVHILKQALSSVLYAQGVSNHMGSSATKDSRIMSVLFTELKKQNLFFLDNLVVEESICQQLASEQDLRCAARDVFLDNRNEAEYIKGQFQQLCKVALAYGQAIGICHARPLTLEVLRDEAPLMQEQGIQFVFVSDLIE